MAQREAHEDLGFVLAFVPFLGSAIYALALWIPRGVSGGFPQDIFLSVTKDPYLFLVGYVALLGGAVVEVRASSMPAEKLGAVVGRLQLVAVISFVLALILAWIAAGFGSAGATLGLLIAGRYAILFPAALLVTSLGVGLATGRRTETGLAAGFAGVIPMIGSAVVLLAGSRTAAPWPLTVGVAMALLVGGVIVIFARRT